MEKKYRNWLIAIFLLTLFIRLTLAFLIPNFTYESYFHLRQVDHITETGLPIYSDDLSYGGREFNFNPFFHYLMAFFNLFLPLGIIAKIIPNLLLASLTIIVYLISKRITKNKVAPFFSAFIAGFLPILFLTNAFNKETLFLPLVFLTLYFFLKIDSKKHLYWYIILFLILCLTSPATILLLIGFGIYLLLSIVEKKRINSGELELIFFSLLFYLWTQLLIFKNILIQKGVAFIWQNVPSTILSQYFPQPNLAQAVVLVSAVPFLAGIFVLYLSLFHLKNKKSFLFISLAISTALLAWFQLIEFKLALAFFGIILAILFSSFYQETFQFLKKTKAAPYLKHLALGVILLLALTMVFPAVNNALKQNIPQDLAAFQWLKENTPKDAGALALLEEGHLITYLGERRNLLDDQFGSIKDVDQRFADLTTIFRTSFQTQALKHLDQYKLQYLILTPAAKEKYNLTSFNYLTPECFELVYTGQTKIYKVKCTLSNKNEN